jgi:hypothetical protein
VNEHSASDVRCVATFGAANRDRLQSQWARTVPGTAAPLAGLALTDELAEPRNICLREEELAIRDPDSNAVLSREALNVLPRAVENRNKFQCRVTRCTICHGSSPRRQGGYNQSPSHRLAMGWNDLQMG